MKRNWIIGFFGMFLLAGATGCEHEARLKQAREERGTWAEQRENRIKELQDAGMSYTEALQTFTREDSFEALRKRQDREAGADDRITGDELKQILNDP